MVGEESVFPSEINKETLQKTTCRVGLFVTCLVDLFRPTIGFAAIRLLEQAGCVVEVPIQQTCCGQPAYNSGDYSDTRAIARQVIAAFADYDYVVVPSGSCAGMIIHHYPTLFPDPSPDLEAARFLAHRCWELTQFLVECRDMKATDIQANVTTIATYHDSCSGLRELKIHEQPRHLLAGVCGLKLTELPGADICCGFGGAFCVKYPEISNQMVTEKIDAIDKTGADLLLAGDLGCLMNIAGKLHRRGSSVAVRHIAEILADITDVPPIGGVP